MNYYGPREMMDAAGKPTGKWHYTCRNDGQTWAVGNCSPWESCPKCKDDQTKMLDCFGRDDCDVCHGKRLVCPESPCLGHDTPENACEHQKQYVLSKAKFMGPKPPSSWPKNKCEVDGCNEEGTFCGTCGGSIAYELCSAHANLEALSKLVHVGESMSSY